MLEGIDEACSRESGAQLVHVRDMCELELSDLRWSPERSTELAARHRKERGLAHWQKETEVCL